MDCALKTRGIKYLNVESCLLFVPPIKISSCDSLQLQTRSLLSGRKYILQHCCGKTMDDKMTLYRECCFPYCKKL